MFQTLIIFLTATSFVAHGLLGCCWHHAHSDMGHSGASACTESSHGHSEPHSACHERNVPVDAIDHDGDQHQCPGTPHHQECHEAHCVFTRTQDNVKDFADVLTASVSFLLTVAALPAPTPIVGDFGTLADDPISAAAPLYARHCAWLI